MSRPVKRIGHIDFCEEYEVGSQPPEGYNHWHDWAKTQEKGGLKQKQCGNCCLWKYPQELSGKRIRGEAFKDKAMTKKVVTYSPVCNECDNGKTAAS